MSDTLINSLPPIGAAAMDTLVPVQLAGASIAQKMTLAQAGASIVAAPDGYTATPSGAVARSLLSKLSEVTSPYDFGAKGDGATDDTVALQTWLSTSGNKIWPPGIFKTTATLSITANNIHIRGVRGATVLAPSFSAGDVLQIGTSVSITSSVVIDGLTVTPSVTRTTGASINISGQRITLREVDVNNGWDGIAVISYGNQSAVRLENMIAQGCSNNGLAIGTSGVALPNDVYLSHFQTSGCKVGFYAGWLSGLYMAKCQFYTSTQQGAVISPTTPGYVNDCYISDTLFDSSGAEGVLFSGTGKIGSIFFDGGSSSTSGSHGMLVSSGTALNGLTLRGMNLGQNQLSGFTNVSTAAVNVNLLGNLVACNSRAGSGTASGIGIGAGVSAFQIIGNQCGSVGWLAAAGVPNLQGYGIFIDVGAGNNFVISGNLVRGNVTGGVINGATGPNVSVTGNITF